MCETELPALALSSYDNVSLAVSAIQESGNQGSSLSDGVIVLQRPSDAILRAELDSDCGGSAYHVSYQAEALQGDFISYSVDSCSNFVDFGGEQNSEAVVNDRGCPDPRKANNRQCPCVNPSGSGQCSTLPCFDPS